MKPHILCYQDPSQVLSHLHATSSTCNFLCCPLHPRAFALTVPPAWRLCLNSRNVCFQSFGGQKSKIKVLAEPGHSVGSREGLFQLFQPLGLQGGSFLLLGLLAPLGLRLHQSSLCFHLRTALFPMCICVYPNVPLVIRAPVIGQGHPHPV